MVYTIEGGANLGPKEEREDCNCRDQVRARRGTLGPCGVVVWDGESGGGHTERKTLS